MKKWLASSLLLLIGIQSAYATDLLNVIELAKKNDPQYRQALTSYLSTKENLTQARSALFPAIQGTASESVYNKTKVIAGGTNTTISDRTKNYGLTITQPLLSVTSWVEVKREHQIVSQAQANLKSAELDLYVRTANAYFAVLTARDTLRYTHAQKIAAARQYDQVHERFKVGLAAITAVYDSKAAYDAVIAKEIGDRKSVENSLEALRQITGVLHESLAPLTDNTPLLRPDPDDNSIWVNYGLSGNFDLLAKQFAVKAAHDLVSEQRTNFLPTLSVVGSYTDNSNRDIITTEYSSKVTDVSLQFSTPVFQGLNLVSLTRQKQFDYETALASLDQTRKSVVSMVRQSFNNVISGISVVRADRQAVLSAKTSMESNEVAYRVGTVTIVDVLDSQQTLYNNQRQLAVDIYAYMNAIIELKRDAGVLTVADLQQMNSWLIRDKEVSLYPSDDSKPEPIQKISKGVRSDKQ